MMLECFNHDHNPSPVKYMIRLKKDIHIEKNQYYRTDITIPAGTYGYIDDSIEFDQQPNDFCHYCVFSPDTGFMPPDSRGWICAWAYKNF